LQEEFSLFDEDGSNNISMDELGNVVRSLGYAPTMDQLKSWMAEFDASKDGVLSLDEFLKMMEAKVYSELFSHINGSGLTRNIKFLFLLSA
jgi:calmodulin